MAIYSLVYGIYLDKSWKNNSPITTYQFNNHNSSQTIQQPSATGNNSRNLNHLFNSFNVSFVINNLNKVVVVVFWEGCGGDGAWRQWSLFA